VYETFIDTSFLYSGDVVEVWTIIFNFFSFSLKLWFGVGAFSAGVDCFGLITLFTQIY
jgi:hypothetical protein